MKGGNESRELDSLLVGIAHDFLTRRCAATRSYCLVLDPHITFLHWFRTHDFPCAFLFQDREKLNVGLHLATFWKPWIVTSMMS